MTPTTNHRPAATTKRKRISVYNAKFTMRLPIENDDAQECIARRKKIEEYAKTLGAVDIHAHGEFGSTMVDVPK